MIAFQGVKEDQKKVVKLVAFIWLILLSCKFCSVETNFMYVRSCCMTQFRKKTEIKESTKKKCIEVEKKRSWYDDEDTFARIYIYEDDVQLKQFRLITF